MLVTLSCLTLCNPMDGSLPASSVHGILQVRVMEWVSISFSRGSSQPRDCTQVLCIALQADSLPSEPPWKPNTILVYFKSGERAALKCSHHTYKRQLSELMDMFISLIVVNILLTHIVVAQPPSHGRWLFVTPWRLQYARPPCPSPSPRVCPNPCPLS